MLVQEAFFSKSQARGQGSVSTRRRDRYVFVFAQYRVDARMAGRNSACLVVVVIRPIILWLL